MNTNPDTDQDAPARIGSGRRTRTVVGLVLIVLILGALIWFGVTHSETREEQGGPLVVRSSAFPVVTLTGKPFASGWG